MKYEIIKGSEKDFEGAPEWAVYMAKPKKASENNTAWVSVDDDKYRYKHDGGEEFQGLFIKWGWKHGVEIIAERRPIIETTAICKTCGTDHSDNGGKCRGLFGIKKESVWDGEGLPSAGDKVEYRSKLSLPPFDWSPATVKYISQYTVVLEVNFVNDEDNEVVHYADNIIFRSVSSESSVQRKAAIEEINNLVGDIEKYPSWTSAIEAIYDMGYRKVGS